MLYENLSDINFAFLDVETTGLDPYLGDRVCEIAILKTRSGKILDKFETLINPGRGMPPQAVSVNGITNEVFEYFLLDLERRGIRIKRLKDMLKLQGGSVVFEKSDELVLPPVIEEALRANGKLQIKSLSAYSETTSTRIIEPLEVNVSGSFTYLLAFCHLRKEKCSFRLDRILEVKTIS